MRRSRVAMVLGGAAAVALVTTVVVLPHRSSSTHRTAAATSTPQPGSASPSASALPALAGPRLFPLDDMQMRAPLAFGRISLSTQGGTTFDRYVLAVPSTSLPSSATVWRLGQLDRAGLPGVGAFFDVGPVPSPQPGTSTYAWSFSPSLTVDTGYGTLDYEGTPTHLSLGTAPRDALSAVLRADHVLDAIGVQMSGRGKPQPENVDGRWIVTYPRILDFPVDGARALVDFDTEGTLGALQVNMQPLRGGSTYQLAPWQQAWRQVASGRWYAIQGDFEHGNGGPMNLGDFHATSVRLGYYEPQDMSSAPIDALVPMYVFHDSGSNVDLYYPALTASEMSYRWEPPPPQQ